MKLIIVESPTKAKTLSRFLKGTYSVEATMGHIRDLPKAALGVDIEHDFAPSYIIPRDKKKRAGELTEIAGKADQIILATDPDREGEAIAWHVMELLSAKATAKKTKAPKKPKGKQELQRIVFHEITESAIHEALAHPREVDAKLVNAQQARRVLDRLVGYKLSPLLWQKLSRRWLSAGRVQSVAVRLIVEREREIAKFAKEEFWIIDGTFLPEGKRAGDDAIIAGLVAKDDVKYEQVLTYELFDGKYTTTKTTIASGEQAAAIVSDLSQPFTVSAVEKKEIKRFPAAPYTTSTLQQDAGRKLYFSSKKTMQLAQKLYEEGFITYHRTDSVNLAEKFIDEARAYIGKAYGQEYVPEEPKRYQTKSRVAQEAHEAIRPTDVTLKSDGLHDGGELNRDHVRLYDLIWKRAIGSQAREAVFDSTTIRISSSNGYLFEAQGSVVKFDGFLKIIGRENNEVILPDVAVGEEVKLVNAVPAQRFTNPPPRYSEASLVKTLEEKDIGRPSTYAPIISTIIERHYVTKEEKKLVPTELGDAVTDFLVKYFPDIMQLPFTAKFEAGLDEVANGATEWVPVVREFYGPFAHDLETAYADAEKVKVAEEAFGEACPDCGSPLVIRMGRYGKFIACSTFPKCRYTRQYGERVDMKCPRCGGDIILKKSRRGKAFYGCSNYPKCNFAAWKKEDIK